MTLELEIALTKEEIERAVMELALAKLNLGAPVSYDDAIVTGLHCYEVRVKYIPDSNLAMKSKPTARYVEPVHKPPLYDSELVDVVIARSDDDDPF